MLEGAPRYDKCKELIIAGGGVKALVAALRAVPGDEAVQVNGCRALCALADGEESGQQILAEGGPCSTEPCFFAPLAVQALHS